MQRGASEEKLAAVLDIGEKCHALNFGIPEKEEEEAEKAPQDEDDGQVSSDEADPDRKGLQSAARTHSALVSAIKILYKGERGEI